MTAERRQGIRKLARATRGEKPQRVTTIRRCVIDHVVSGGAADGSTAAFATYGGDVFPAAYLSAYTPTAGDQVAVAFVDGSPLILGLVAGPPAF